METIANVPDHHSGVLTWNWCCRFTILENISQIIPLAPIHSQLFGSSTNLWIFYKQDLPPTILIPPFHIQKHGSIYKMGEPLYSSSRGCHNKILQTKWLKQQKLISLRSGGSKSKVKGLAGQVSSEASPSWCAGGCPLAVSSRGHPSVHLPCCLSVSSPPLCRRPLVWQN